ncbi:thrombospondin-2-like [Lytechinus pictus]|uniref:thrombospondin-2-like n=1 Tax=Lytechinus pictus TaxID=7653 RepID=UPI0030BA0C16
MMKLKGLFSFLLLVGISSMVSSMLVLDTDDLGWSEWGECSRRCGGGSQSRNVICDEGIEPQLCSYLKSSIPRRQLMQERECNTQPCEVRGTWSAWSDWHACSATCGSSVFKMRTRSCNDDNDNQLGSLNCNGLTYEWRQCEGLPVCPSNDQSNDLTSHVEHGYELHSFSSFQSYNKISEVEELSALSWSESSYDI